ncbi:hypothetical protein AVEN_94322-1 [Araneus ventricosus]|uniref:Uncharacterized protein n=1 Tax=Araneus ventricosus TaxID=182803 RepID=A0A4Y2NRD8_ARAVE|nr:hypothetical protein AVEN_94322-1 [Araneus ventricosus]
MSTDSQGKNGSFELFLEDDGGAFSVQPSRGMNELNFALLVKDPTKLDYETSDTKYIEFRLRIFAEHINPHYRLGIFSIPPYRLDIFSVPPYRLDIFSVPP